jgi:large subunit ribosomal protein L24
MNRESKKYKIKRDDQVMVITGKEKGKTGKVLKIDRNKDRVIVQGLNMVKKAVKQRRQNEKGGIIDIEAGIHLSNVMLMCKTCGPTRAGYTFEQAGKKRVCRKCGEQL